MQIENNGESGIQVTYGENLTEPLVTDKTSTLGLYTKLERNLRGRRRHLFHWDLPHGGWGRAAGGKFPHCLRPLHGTDARIVKNTAEDHQAA